MQRIFCITSFAALAAMLAACGGGSSGSTPWVPPNPPSSNVAMPQAPVVKSVHGVATVEMQAVIDPSTGLPAFEYQGHDGTAPTIEVKAGDTIVIDLANELPGGGMQSGMQNDMNLHFHGLTVSPLPPADDVLTMLAMPGNTLHYVVPIPKTQEPGLYWYHPHVHGETNYQVGESGMSGAIVIDGLEQHIPALASMRQQVIVVRDVSDSAADAVPNAETDMAPMSPHRRKPMDVDQNTNPCGPDPANVHFTVNGVSRPTIVVKPGESQFFRVVNATGHRNLVLAMDGVSLQVVAVDGVALDAYPGTPATFTTPNFVLPPAGRVEFVATAPASGASEFRTLCYNSGPGGDPDPASILADIRPSLSSAATHVTSLRRAVSLRVGAPLPRNPLSASLPPISAQRIVRFTEDTNGFYINGQFFNPNGPPMFTVHTGTIEQWTVANLTEEVHDFHTHQVHFYVESVNGNAVAHPHWSDSFVVPPRRPTVNGAFLPGTIVAIVDFRNPVIRGTFVFHCHILDHEDNGMMAKIQAL